MDGPGEDEDQGPIIVFVPEIEAWGGGERVYLSLLRHLHDKGLKFKFVSYFQSIDMQSFADFPLNIELLNPKRNPLSKSLTLRRLLRRHPTRPKPLLFNIQSAIHAFSANHAHFAVLILDTPSLLNPPGKGTMKQRLREYLSNKVVTWSLRGVEPVIATTDYMAKEMRALWMVDPTVSRQGVQTIVLEGHYRSVTETDPFEIVSVCRLEPNKRIDWIIDALANLESGETPLSRTVNWRLTIVGQGTLEQDLKGQSQQLGLDGRVTFAGFVDDAELEDIYRKSNLSLMPAVQGYGLPALEALTRRIPVILHSDSGVSEILVGSPWARVFTGGVPALAASIKELSQSIVRGELADTSLPDFPTDDEWAAEVCSLCQWV